MGSGAAPAGFAAERITSRPLDWVMLDCEVRRSRDHDFRNASWAYGVTSSGDRIGVGLSAAAPPQTSILLLNWRADTSKEEQDDDGRERFGYGYEPNEWPSDAARAVAAHRGAILLRFALPTTRGNRDEEFFVYQARPAANATLTRLPACGRHERVNFDDTNTMGILCLDHDGGRAGDFAVAHLTVTHNPNDTVTAELCRLRGGRDGAWSTCTPLPIRHAAGKGGDDDLIWWETDAVVNVGDSTIGWVDYLRGILFCDDVLSPNPELRYVPLPVNAHEGCENDGIGGRRTLSPFRSVCVTTNRDNGATTIKFVDVAPWNVWFYGDPDYSRRIPAITSWTLSRDRRTWVEDGRIDVVDFFDLAKRHNLPCVLPEYPVVDMKHPQKIYVALRDGVFTDDKMFLVALNMTSKTIDECLHYACIYESDDEGNINIGVTYNLPFLPSEFSKYLGLVVPDSLAPPSASDSDAHSERPCASAAAGNVIRFGSVSFEEVCSKEEQVCTAAGLRSKLIFGDALCLKKAGRKRPSTVQIGSVGVEIKDVLLSSPFYQKPILKFG